MEENVKLINAGQCDSQVCHQIVTISHNLERVFAVPFFTHLHPPSSVSAMRMNHTLLKMKVKRLYPVRECERQETKIDRYADTEYEHFQ